MSSPNNNPAYLLWKHHHIRHIWLQTEHRSMAHNRSYRPWTQTVCQLVMFDIWSRQNNPRASVSLCKTSPLKLKNCFVTNHYSFNTHVPSFGDFAHSQISNTCILKIVPNHTLAQCLLWLGNTLASNNFGPIHFTWGLNFKLPICSCCCMLHKYRLENVPCLKMLFHKD